MLSDTGALMIRTLATPEHDHAAVGEAGYRHLSKGLARYEVTSTRAAEAVVLLIARDMGFASNLPKISLALKGNRRRLGGYNTMTAEITMGTRALSILIHELAHHYDVRVARTYQRGKAHGASFKRALVACHLALHRVTGLGTADVRRQSTPRRTAASVPAADKPRAGAVVEVRSPRRGTWIGRVVKVNRTRAVVENASGDGWNVPFALIHPHTGPAPARRGSDVLTTLLGNSW